MATIYLALGTNLGDRSANLRLAVERLPSTVTVEARSPVYETPPWGVTDQPNFLNMVLKGTTNMRPRLLLKFLKLMERDLGRKPTIRYGPRLIDIDILFYDTLVLESPGLTIPHPRLHERAFVLIPLNDIAPGLLHPRLRKTIAELCAAVDPTGVRRYE